jgi:tetratricopeptide (TPR) repeat protein
MPKLPNELRETIDKLCQKGDQFAQIDQLDDALDQYEAAWELLPDPKDQWPAATWILMAAGDIYFEKRDFVAASETLQEALCYPDGEHKFIQLRLGQSLLEIGDLNAAANMLESAFQNGGEEIFDGEDPKYLNFVKTQLGVMRVQSKSKPGPSNRFNKPLQ